MTAFYFIVKTTWPISDKNMTRADQSHFTNKRPAYYHCTRCCKEATPSCLRHKQQIELFLGSEIEKLSARKQYQCHQCTKIGYSSESRIICWFCSSTSIKLFWFRTALNFRTAFSKSIPTLWPRNKINSFYHNIYFYALATKAYK